MPPTNLTTGSQELNYKALVSIRRASRAWLITALSASVVFVVCLTYLILTTSQASFAARAPTVGDSFFETVFVSCLVIIFVGISGYLIVRRFRQTSAFYQFLHDNGWHQSDEANSKSAIAPVLQQHIGRGNDTDWVAYSWWGNYGAQPFTVGIYVYETGIGNSQWAHTWTSLHIELQKSFPLILLDNTRNNRLGLSNLPLHVGDSSKSLQLEGDFNRHFKVQIQPNTQDDVLAVMTPDFMIELLAAPAVDIQIEGKNLYIIRPKEAINLKSIQQLFAAVDVVLKHMQELEKVGGASEE